MKNLEQMCTEAFFLSQQAKIHESELSSFPISATSPDISQLELIKAKARQEISEIIDDIDKETAQEKSTRINYLEKRLEALRAYENASPDQIAILCPSEKEEKIKAMHSSEMLLEEMAKIRKEAQTKGITFEGREIDKVVTVYEPNPYSWLPIFTSDEKKGFTCLQVVLVNEKPETMIIGSQTIFSTVSNNN